MFGGSAAKARYLSRWRAVVGDLLNERIGAALNVRNPPVAGRHMNIWRPARFKQKCESFCPPRSRNFSVISETCFIWLIRDTVMTDVDGATYFLRAEGRPVGNVPRKEFIRLGVDVVLKSVFNVPKAPKGYTFARSIRVGPRAMVFGFRPIEPPPGAAAIEPPPGVRRFPRPPRRTSPRPSSGSTRN